MAEEVVQINVNELQSNPLQPRGAITPESLVDLVDSIKEHGVLEPLVVAKTPAGFQIIAGERRWRASRLAGLSTVPALIRETSPRGMLEMALVENVQRIDLNPLERAQAYRRLMDEFNLTNGEISIRVSKSPSYISNTIRLLTLPDALKDALMAGATSEGHVRALSALEDPHLIIEAYKEVLRKNLSVRGTEELVRRLRARVGLPPKKSAVIEDMHIISEEIDNIESDLAATLSRFLKTEVKLEQTGKKATVRLFIEGTPDQTVEILKDINQAISGYFNLKT